MKKKITKKHEELYRKYCNTTFPADRNRVFIVCPFCSQTRSKSTLKDLGIGSDGGYKCHHCEEKGNIAIEYKMHTGKSGDTTKLHFASAQNRPVVVCVNQHLTENKKESIDILKDHVSLEFVHNKISYEIEKLKKNENTEILNKYAELRGLSPDIYSFFGCFGCVDRFGTERIVYPSYYDFEGTRYLIGAKLKPADPALKKVQKMYQVTGGLYSCVPFLGYDIDLTQSSKIVITEGEDDAIACAYAGIRNSVSVPDGSSKDEIKQDSGKLKFLKSMKEQIEQAEAVVIFSDNDISGANMENALIEAIGIMKSCIVRKYDELKDANDIFKEHGPEFLKQVVNSAQHKPSDYVWDNSELIKLLCKPEPAPVVFKSHTPFDEYFRLRPEEITVFTGVPASGKSTYVEHLTTQICKNNNARLHIYTPEGTGEINAARRICWAYDGGRQKTVSREALLFFESKIRFFKSYKRAGSKFEHPSIAKILEEAQILCLQSNADINIFLIDPWNGIEHDQQAHERDDQYLRRIFDQIKAFCLDTKSHVIIVAHPSKVIDKDAEIDAYNISQGAMWFNKFDNVISVDRIKEEDGVSLEGDLTPATIRTIKVKDFYTGKEGYCNNFKFNIRKRVFEEYSHIGVRELRRLKKSEKQQSEKSLFKKSSGKSSDKSFPNSFDDTFARNTTN